MKLLTRELLHLVHAEIVQPLAAGQIQEASESMARVLADLHRSIPEKKRISYGRVYTIKVLAAELFQRLDSTPERAFGAAAGLFEQDNPWQVRGTALGVLSHCGLGDPLPVLPYFRSAAASDTWEIRELSQMFFRKLIQAHPREMQSLLHAFSQSGDPNLRRFVAETLRPVGENRWFFDHPEYPLSVLRRMFREASPYPRTAVGNNLSDLARRLPERVYTLVQELVATGDKNACWIATRACRNLIKLDPKRVMDLLQIQKYRYKDRVYCRKEIQN